MEKDVYSASKLAFHKDKLDALSRGKITAPIYVRVKPTNKCNHRCYYCSYAPGSNCVVSETVNLQDEIPFDKMMEILSDFKSMGVKAITFSGGGEPLVYPYITEALKKVLDYGIDLSIITNGQNLKGENAELLAKAKWVRISSDASNAHNFTEIRRIPESKFYELAENIRNFAKIKNKDCELGINFVVNEKNAHSVYDSAKYFRELGANHIKITPAYFPNFFEYHKPIKQGVIAQIEKAQRELNDDNFKVYETYSVDFKFSGVSERRYLKCYIMQTIPVIAADSTVYFCHDKTYTKNGALGSLKNRSFKDLWFSEEAKKIFDNFDPREGCKHHCTYDPRNFSFMEMLSDLNNLEKYRPESEIHKNFI